MFRSSWLTFKVSISGVSRIVRGSPVITLMVPDCVAGILILAGVLGVWVASHNNQDDLETFAGHLAQTLARDVELLLSSYVAPAVAISQLVSQQPYVPDLLQKADIYLPEIMKALDLKGVIDTSASASIQPWNIKTANYPFIPGGIGPFQDFNVNPSFQKGVLWGAKQGPGFKDLMGPLPPRPWLCAHPAFCARQVIWLPSNNTNETWGNEVVYTTPWSKNQSTPVFLGNSTVHPKYRQELGAAAAYFEDRFSPEGQRLVYRGFVVHCVCSSSVTQIFTSLDAQTPSNESGTSHFYGGNQKYKYALASNCDWTSDGFARALDGLSQPNISVLYQSNTLPSALDMKNKCQKNNAPFLTGLSWTVCIAPEGGFEPGWKVPLYIVVVILSLIMGLLLFHLMVTQENHRVLVKAMLPSAVVKSLRLGKTYAQAFNNVTILFCDIVQYTVLSSQLSPAELVAMLDQLYSGFDALCDRHQLYKVETIGDAFMCVGGAPTSCHPRDAAIRVCKMGLDMIKFADNFTHGDLTIQIRVGVYTGPVTAAVMGKKMPHWCLVGDTVNVASRMESNSLPRRVHIGESTAKLICKSPSFKLSDWGVIDVKGKGPMHTYWVEEGLGDKDAKLSQSPVNLTLKVMASSKATTKRWDSLRGMFH